jgi:hypothetical protein
MGTQGEPLLSVVVVIVSDTTGTRYDTTHLLGTLEALAGQVDAPPMEIIVPYRPPLAGVEELAQRYPQSRFVPVADLRSYTGEAAGREHHDELRARGLALARGEIAGLLEDHGLPDPHWAAAMMAAHREEWAGVGGAIQNGVNRPLNWAVYFCDFARYQNPVGEGESAFASDANVSYKRAALESIASVWRDSFQETAVNWALRSQGKKLALSRGAILYQHRMGLRVADSLTERFVWGRSYAASRCGLIGRGKQLVYAALAPAISAVLVARMARTAFSRGRLRGAFVKALPLTALLTLAWSAGEMSAYLKGGGATPEVGRQRLARSAG